MDELDEVRSDAPAAAVRPVTTGRVGRLRRRLVVQVVGCMIGIGALQMTGRALLPGRPGPGLTFALSMGGNMLIAAGIATATCSMLRLLLPASFREAVAAAASIGLFYLAVVLSFVGVDLVGVATATPDAVLVGLLASVLVLGLVAARRGARTEAAHPAPAGSPAASSERLHPSHR